MVTYSESSLIAVDTQSNGHSCMINNGGMAASNDNFHFQRDKFPSGSIRSTFYPRIPVISRNNTLSNDGLKKEKTVSEAKINNLFDSYRDPAEEQILTEGIERLCSDLHLSPDEFKVLVLAWKLDAQQMCRFTREEFVNGLKSLHTDSIRGIQVKLPEIVNILAQDAEQFKSLYRFTFKFGLDANQRILPSDMAICLWKLVFTVREPPILSRWLTFLECHPHIRGIPRDTWNMFLNFAESIGNDLSTYDDTEAWPSIFDDFVEFENDKTNQNVSIINAKDSVCNSDMIPMTE